MSKYYLNDDHTYRPAELMEWAMQLEELSQTGKRKVANDIIHGKHVSTVWLGLNHNFGIGKPLVFETMVFSEHDSATDIYMDRYTTWEEAEAGHKKAIEWVKKHYG